MHLSPNHRAFLLGALFLIATSALTFPKSTSTDPISSSSSARPLDPSQLTKRTYRVISTHRNKGHLIRSYYPHTISLAALASTSPTIPESLRRKIALHYFRPSEYDLAKAAFANIVSAAETKNDTRLLDLEIDIDGASAIELCRKASQRGDGTDIHAAIRNKKDGAGNWNQSIVICDGFWIDIERVVAPTCDNIGVVVSHQMRFAAGTLLHEML